MLRQLQYNKVNRIWSVFVQSVLFTYFLLRTSLLSTNGISIFKQYVQNVRHFHEYIFNFHEMFFIGKKLKINMLSVTCDQIYEGLLLVG